MWMRSIHCWHEFAFGIVLFTTVAVFLASRFLFVNYLCVLFRVPCSWSVLFYVCIDSMTASETWLVGWIFLILCSWLFVSVLAVLENNYIFIRRWGHSGYSYLFSSGNNGKRRSLEFLRTLFSDLEVAGWGGSSYVSLSAVLDLCFLWVFLA